MIKAYIFIILSAAGVASFAIVDVVYFQAIGYSLAFVGLLTAVFNFAVAFAELPFSILFDRYSNKMALQVGNALRIIAFLLFFWNLSSESLIFAQILAGIATAAMSGTSNALVVNEIQSKSSDRIAVAFGRISYLSAGASVIGGAVGIWLFSFSPQLIWLSAIVFFVAAGVAIATFHDTRAYIASMSNREYFRGVVAAVRGPFALMLALSNAAAVAPAFLWQIKFDTVSVSFIFIGFLVMQGANMAGPAVMRICKIKVRNVLTATLLNIVAVVWFMFAEDPVSVAFSFGAHVAIHGILLILVSALYHATLDNSFRATAGSVVSLAVSLIVAVVAPVVAILGESFGLASAIGVSVLMYVVIGLLSFNRRVRSRIAQDDLA